MPKDNSPEALSQKEMQRLALIHVQAYVNTCHCQSRTDVLQALAHWQDVGAEMADFIRHTRIIIVH
ncbi:hypothetical protein [Pantoea ananatis]|uniref:hypothetical protein n=1 Tax=Pantoea ananas TaxID=553 RepID=UPI001B30EF84|nr:hypothetical protein [Pantoea ananatis]